ncbi:LapD/MoxY N-terminal periplasmic domain-containing protein [Paracoccus laeviglucosivorans]|uniref:Two-component system, NarL family, sensor histidine kinase UhpB n=1 Tax=Paracoccus laeviglucosivorans TaxID=1197861 RepID=A0A521D648_9RHOB|nr:LapD/MoxY N-terminal periplasmic domain-containing protein [Paracoccus laeviglucosivorans]SMO66350.1 two-component system, NarL family, sensor histidine kinase UhpB [Paracoccus laeviglucosivorans]
MDATGQIGTMAKAQPVGRRRGMALSGIALGGSALVWIVMFAITVTVVIWNARDSVRQETESAFRLANAAATLRLPTSFGRKDMMAEAAMIAADIRSQRHVTAELRDVQGKPVPLPDLATPRDKVPDWFAALLRPEPQRDLIPVTHYPNVLGVLEIRTEPSDEIAEVWRDLRVLLPLLLVTALVAIGVTMAVTGLVLRRLGLLGAALDQMRAGNLEQRAPLTGLTELNDLTEGVNALAAHLAQERAENRRLQARMMTLAEAERARIASDLHDEIGPQLFALHAAVGQATRHKTDPELAETLGAISRHSDAIRKSARAAIDDLRLGPADGASLPEMLHELLIEFEDLAPNTAFRFAADDDLPDPDEAGQIAIYRFVRESVLNALRHAAPAQIGVELRAGSELVARVTDDGVGAAVSQRRGMGQTGMRDRAAALGATWLAPERRDERTVTEFRIPMNQGAP